jgi:hypothetical protein
LRERKSERSGGTQRLLVVLGSLLAASVAAAGGAEDYVDAQLRVVKGLEAQAGPLAKQADEAVARLLEGGKLYLAGERGMVLELVTRAGGLCGAQAFQPGKTRLAGHDVVLFADYGQAVTRAEMGWNQAVESGALILLFASGQHPVLAKPLAPNVRAVLIDIPLDSRLVALPSGERVVPAATPALAIAQWTFVAELIGAGRRKGKHLAVYLSIHLDEGRKRFERTKGLLFEPELKTELAPAGQLAKQFLGHVRDSLEAVRRGETAKLRTAAAWLREAKASGKKAVRHLYGHLPPTEAGLPGDPACFTSTVTGPVGDKGVEWIRKNLREGGFYLLVGYQESEDAMSGAANELGARTVFITSRGPGEAQAKSPRHLHIDPHWPLSDGCIELPGYDVKACPLSGILGLACYYAICSEALAAK